ncbi:MAG TPA: secretion protein [Chryseobacterium sp.]|nr:secretion protein [Chryseobacterium sp.]
MKRFYKMSMKLVVAYFLMKFTVAEAQLTVMGLGNYDVGGVSNNGVVGLQLTTSGKIFKWTAGGGLLQIGSISNGYPSTGRTVVSNDGTRFSSTYTNSVTSFNEISTYDTTTSAWTNRGGLVVTGWGGVVSSSWGISQDGNTIVGLGYLSAGVAHAIKWDAINGMIDLGSIVTGRSSRANAISANGSVIVGWQDEPTGIRSGAKWVDGVESFITDNSGNNVGEASGVSADGSTIIGGAIPNPYVWKAGSGLTYITHPNASNTFRGGATGISADGSKVIGFYRTSGAPPMSGEGFIWTSETGRVNLNDYAVGLGIATNGVTMGLPLAISQDGMKIAGVGFNGSNQIVAFYLDLTTYLSTKETMKDKNSIAIYPNPVADILYFKGIGKMEKAEIYNMVGQKVKSLNAVESQIDVSFLSKGDYILEYSVKGEKQQTYKFIKK